MCACMWDGPMGIWVRGASCARAVCRDEPTPEPVSKGGDDQLDRKDDGEGHVEELELPPHGRGSTEGVGELVRDLLFVCCLS